MFFDRDGVINIDHGYIYRAEQFDWMPGAAEAILAVKASGRRAFMITNQAGVARGYYDEAAIARLHAYVQATLGEQGAAFDDIRYCPHHPQGVVPAYTGVCACRKPGTGMIDSLTDQWPTDRARSGLIGDKPSDLEAGARAGLRVRLFTGGDLREAVAALLAELDGTGG